MKNIQFVLFYRLKDEPLNTAHLVLVSSIAEAAEELARLKDVQWASLCNNKYKEVRTLSELM